MNDKSFESILLDIVSDFYNTFDLTPVSVTYSVAEDVGKAYALLRPDLVANNPSQIVEAKKYNGLTVPPDSLDGTFAVLLNGPILWQYMKEGNATWIGTVVHETTHAIDYSEYADLVWVDSYDDILSLDKHSMFRLWTEMNARAKGYYFVRKYTFDDITDVRQVNDILKIELPGQSELFYQNYHATKNGHEQAYLTAQYLGRLYTLQQLFPGTFNNNFIRQHLAPNKWMYDWFTFYCRYPRLSDAYEHFDEMKAILRQNFRRL